MNSSMFTLKLASFPGSYPAGWDLGMRLYQTPCLVASTGYSTKVCFRGVVRATVHMHI